MCKTCGLIALAALAFAAPLSAGDAPSRTWTFDDEPTGRIAGGFTSVVGSWSVVASDKGHALAQSARNADPVFNIALVDDTNARDVVITVRFKAIAGDLDRGGGLVWRARDAKNYYLARYNPLEDNYRLYKVVDGTRTLFASVDIPHSDGWHTLRVTMTGDRIECDYDGKTYLKQRDATFPDAGKIGLWSKSDAQSQFDDLTLNER